MLSRNAFDNIVIKGGIRPGHGRRGQLTCFELLRKYVSKQKDTIMDSTCWNRRVTTRTDMKLWAVAVWGWGEMGTGLTTSTFYVSVLSEFLHWSKYCSYNQNARNIFLLWTKLKKRNSYEWLSHTRSWLLTITISSKLIHTAPLCSMRRRKATPTMTGFVGKHSLQSTPEATCVFRWGVTGGTPRGYCTDLQL